MVGTIQSMPTRIFPRRKLRLFIKEHREAAELTQEQLANRLGSQVSDVTISRWETGKRRPDLDALAAIAEALGKEPEDLYRHPDEQSADELLRGQPAEVKVEAYKIIRAIRR